MTAIAKESAALTKIKSVISPEVTARSLIAQAGIEVAGQNPGDIQVHDEQFYERTVRQGVLGLGESYIDGWWDSENLDITLSKMSEADLASRIMPSPALMRSLITAKISNRQSRYRAPKNAASHYNLGNDLFESMLDKRMIYSCAYWFDAKGHEAASLDEAQAAKLDLICRKLQLEPGMSLLDIGCGWGGFSGYAAENYGVKVTAVSPASEQVKLARQRTRGLDVRVLQKDYRAITGSFDRIVSIGMLEHVGPKNLAQFFAVCKGLLKPDGMMLHHLIINNQPMLVANPYTDKYVFPGGVIPANSQITEASESDFTIKDLQSFGTDYDTTLMAWDDNFRRGYPDLHALSASYDERFYRMWRFYLLGSAASFRTARLQLNQYVMEPKNHPSRYISAR